MTKVVTRLVTAWVFVTRQAGSWMFATREASTNWKFKTKVVNTDLTHGVWILNDGTWNDDGIWLGGAIWKDS